MDKRQCDLCSREITIAEDDIPLCESCQRTGRAWAKAAKAEREYVQDCKDDPLLDRRMR